MLGPLLGLLLFVALARAQQCSKTQLCATGCCSSAGYCGFGDDYCGTGCQSTCDAKLGCDKNNPCKDRTCCSKFGFCGLGPDYCSKDNCVATCDAKSYCDPGYGAEWSEIGECPLRTCCSKWGFCGITEEFCGDKKVQRPSCDKSLRAVDRVVGYYEGWGARRKCNQFKPKNIRRGVYTHINFAFASINPTTFEVVPAEDGDKLLYKELTDMKFDDRNLKVFIAIGGWNFNEPWMATKTTFSDLAASEENQKKFFRSLISFMNTYNFDGVDIDWEYPAAEERSGRDADFANFPTFIRNLRSALDSSVASRNGLTLTLPMSYWYLRHFDIRALEPHVDFFNIMSYDLHGTWDEGNRWLGAYLNSHTNLTEITNYLDLLWRNDIAPSKVVLGLAFYSRTFNLVDPSCNTPGCTFHGGGAPGLCSDNVGTLMQSELHQARIEANASPDFDKTAAVKYFTKGNMWITYDDGGTWELKIDFAKSQCLGGVMVWAISQDLLDGTYSKQLQKQTGYFAPDIKPDAVTNGATDTADFSVNRPQCRWSNCGEDCGADYFPIYRDDSDRHNNYEIMLDPTNCRDNQARVFCCPTYSTPPKCGWYGFYNGQCTGECPEGRVSVGHMRAACNTYAKTQAACCETHAWVNGEDLGELNSMALYAPCQWETPCRLNTGQCTTGTALGWSRWGDGGQTCAGSDTREPFIRLPYCCSGQAEDKGWKDCSWQGTETTQDGFCHSSCPNDKVRLGMESVVPGCSSGGHAFCCRPVYKTAAVSLHDDVVVYQEALTMLLGNPTCSTKQKSLSLAMDSFAQNKTLAANGGKGGEGGNLTLGGPEPGLSGVTKQADMIFDLAKKIVQDLIAKLSYARSSIDPLEYSEFSSAWDQKIKDYASNGHEPYKSLDHNALATYVGAMPTQNVPSLVSAMPCELGSIAVDIGNGKTEEKPLCDWIWETESEFTQDIDDGGHDGDGRPSKRSSVPDVEALEPDEDGNWPETAADGSVYPWAEVYHDLVKRGEGGERSYTVNPAKNEPTIQNAPKFTVSSSKYPNGNEGNDLITATNDKDKHRYLVESSGCGPSDYKLLDKADPLKAPGKWVSEHILELQAFPRFLESAITGKFRNPNMPGASQFGTMDKIGYSYLQQIIIMPPKWSDPTRTPQKLALAHLGSTDFPTGMVVCEAALNAIKSRVFRFFDPVSATKWATCCSSSSRANSEAAFSHIQRVMGLFDYYRDANVKDRHKWAFEQVRDVLKDYESSWQLSSGIVAKPWKQYIDLQYQNMGLFAARWLRIMLAELKVTWATVALSSNFQDALWATIVLDIIEAYEKKISGGHCVIDTSIFTV